MPSRDRLLTSSKRLITLSKFIRLILVFAIIVSALFLIWDGFLREQIELYRYPIKYSKIVEECADEYGVPSEIVYAVIRTESSFNKDAVSHVGAKGLMQIIDDTNEWIAFVTGEEIMADRIFEPALNIKRGTWLLSYLYREFGAWEEALAAYNAGIGRVRGWLEDPDISADGVTLDRIPYNETREYVRIVIESAEKYRELYFD